MMTCPALLALVMVAAMHAPDEAAAAAALAADPDTMAIHGTVTDARSGEPLTGVQVRLLELGRTELTHKDGSFHFERLAPGRYTLLVEHIGFRRVVREVSVEENARARVEIVLEFSAIQLPGLVVTGAIGSRVGEEALRATTVVSGQELNRKLDGTLAATLAGEAGLAAVSTGPATARPVIRGLGGDRILLLEDGERTGDLSAESPDHAVAIEAVTARQIEVVRGPATLLYGSNALGGVVNVIREEVPVSLPDRPFGSLSLQGQTVSRGVTAGGHVVGAIGNIALRAEGSARTAGDLRTPVGNVENTGLETYNFSAGASWIPDWGSIGGAYRYYENEYGIPGLIEGEPGHDEPGEEPGGHEDGDHAHGVTMAMRRHTVRGKARIASGIGPFMTLDADATFTDYRHRELEEHGAMATEFTLRTATGEVIARHGALGPFTEGAVGLQAHWRDYAAGGELELTPSKAYAVAGFILEELDLDPVRLQFGARYDWHRVDPAQEGVKAIGVIRTRDFSAVSASIGVLYELFPGVALGASVARAFRTPSANELFSEGPHLATHSFEIGNPDLKSETGLGTDVFLRVTRDRFNAEIAAFRNGISDYIYARNTGDSTAALLPIYQYVNDDAVLLGFEGSAEWSITDRFVVDGAVSYVRGTLTATDEPLPMIPPLNGRLGVRYEADRYFLGAGWKAAARQDRLGEFEMPTDGYHVFDATAGFRWAWLDRVHTVTLRAENLTDAEYRDHLSRIKAIMPQPGRGFSLLYRVNL